MKRVFLDTNILIDYIQARFQVQPEVTLLDNRGLKPAELKLAESIVEEKGGPRC